MVYHGQVENFHAGKWMPQQVVIDRYIRGVSLQAEQLIPTPYNVRPRCFGARGCAVCRRAILWCCASNLWMPSSWEASKPLSPSYWSMEWAMVCQQNTKTLPCRLLCIKMLMYFNPIRRLVDLLINIFRNIRYHPKLLVYAHSLPSWLEKYSGLRCSRLRFL